MHEPEKNVFRISPDCSNLHRRHPLPPDYILKYQQPTGLPNHNGNELSLELMNRIPWG